MIRYWWEDDVKMMAQVDVSASPVVGFSEGIVCSVGFEMIGVGCSEADGIPRWC